MPIKKDDKGNRRVEMEVLLPGTPEQVWHAIATGEGNATWFTKATIEGKVGGAMRFDFGTEFGSSGKVTIWEPPHRFGYAEDTWMEGAPPVATEVTIIGRSGDSCVLRMVHSLFATTDDWDDQMEGFEGGWPGFFAILRIYLEHFAGEKGDSMRVMTSVKGDELELWRRLAAKLNLAGADVGERRTLPEEPQRLSGVVEEVRQGRAQRWVLLRLDDPPGIAMIGTYRTPESVTLSAIAFYYGENASALAKESQPKWRAWLEETFAGHERVKSTCMPEI